MKIEHLQYFVTLASSSSISKAAGKLFISQQQLNRIITALEEEVQAKLFYRTTNGVSLTVDGQDFLLHARNIISEYTALMNHFSLRHSAKSNHLSMSQAECTVFLTPCLSLYGSEIIHNLHNIAPNIKLILYDKTTKLNENYFDRDALCFWAADTTPEDLMLSDGQCLHAEPIGNCHAYFAYNKTLHNLAPIPDCDYALTTATLSHVFAISSNKEQLSLVASNVHQLLDSVLYNDTNCTLPDFVLPKVHSLYPDIAFLRISGASTIQVLYPTTHLLTAADKIVIDFMKSYIQNLQLLAEQLN